MAFRHHLGYELLSGEVPIAEVRVTGGLSQSDRWSQLLADTLGREVLRPLGREVGAAGAAAMAGVAAGAWQSVDDASCAVGVAGTNLRPSRGTKDLSRRTVWAVRIGPSEIGVFVLKGMLMLVDLSWLLAQAERDER